MDAEPMPMATTRETLIDLCGMASGTHVKLYVMTANSAGESMPSSAVEVVVQESRRTGTKDQVP